MRVRLLIFTCCLAVIAGIVRPASAQFAAAGPLGATTIPADHQIQPEQLIPMLKGGSDAPVILQVGSRIFFSEAHIPGSKFAGPGSQPTGIKLLENTVVSLPKDKLIVLYCGCCPWGRCPNVGPAFARLRQLGYQNVKVLYLPNNFGDDWVKKNYPTEH